LRDLCFQKGTQPPIMEPALLRQQLGSHRPATHPPPLTRAARVRARALARAHSFRQHRCHAQVGSSQGSPSARLRRMHAISRTFRQTVAVDRSCAAGNAHARRAGGLLELERQEVRTHGTLESSSRASSALCHAGSMWPKPLSLPHLHNELCQYHLNLEGPSARARRCSAVDCVAVGSALR
jgi:hypothetical protein